MKLNSGLHLAYCTNIHRGETWPEIFEALKTHTLAVRERVCREEPFAIGLRLSQKALTTLLLDKDTKLEFQRWLDKNSCYIFTINGFPFGQFHGTRVKEHVYQPDWTTTKRQLYTLLLFDLLAELVPAGISGSVSTLPLSFKEFQPDASAQRMMREQIWRCVKHIARLSESTGKDLHLGLEPEPLCLLENTAETVQFFSQLRDEYPNDPRLDRHLGVNYDTCHFAVEFEEPHTALQTFVDHNIKISKLHLSSALKVRPTPAALEALKKYSDDVYLHQTIAKDQSGQLQRYRDLPDAIADAVTSVQPPPEWRIHFHVPLHAPAAPPFETTTDHLLGALDFLAANPSLCQHLEMETYTWEVLPSELKSKTVVDQLAAEYAWALAQLRVRGLAPG